MERLPVHRSAVFLSKNGTFRLRHYLKVIKGPGLDYQGQSEQKSVVSTRPAPLVVIEWEIR